MIEYHHDIFCQTPFELQERENVANSISNAVVLLLHYECIFQRKVSAEHHRRGTK